jgi:GrpB-like predicted nucleotidyltransferase (UPF0157 family)
MNIHETIVIAEYDPVWPIRAAEAIAAIRTALGDRLLAIEHVGSTSVPGLAAKAILDLMAGIRTLDEAPACIPSLAALGFEYKSEFEDTLPERRYFRKQIGSERTHHLHMVVYGGEFWVRHLAFRDALRADPALAADYAALKRRLAAEHGADRVGYTDAKTDFIRAVEARALHSR